MCLQVGRCMYLCAHTEARRRYQEPKISVYSFKIKPLLVLRLIFSC